MRINHGRIHILVPQKLLNRPEVVTGFQQMGRKTVAKGMTADPLYNTSSENYGPDRFLKECFVNMMTSFFPGCSVFPAVFLEGEAGDAVRGKPGTLLNSQLAFRFSFISGCSKRMFSPRPRKRG